MYQLKIIYYFHANRRHLAKSAISEKDAIAAGTKIASESILNIRTVASLSKHSF